MDSASSRLLSDKVCRKVRKGHKAYYSYTITTQISWYFNMKVLNLFAHPSPQWAFKNYLVIPGGTIPEKAGKTGIIPRALIRSKFLNCSD